MKACLYWNILEYIGQEKWCQAYDGISYGIFKKKKQAFPSALVLMVLWRVGSKFNMARDLAQHGAGSIR